MSKVAGNCPMGCGETLFLAVGGHVTCSVIDCDDPLAVDKMLAERESEHVVTIHGDGTFTIRHPLRERAEGQLEGCSLHQRLATQARDVMLPEGRFRATQVDGVWQMQDLEASE